MASPFKKLMSEWAKLRIAEPRAQTITEKYKLRQQLDLKWSELLNFPGERMTEEDLELLRHLEDWTVDPKTTAKIGDPPVE
jgi:hypothetical protein